MEEGKTLASLSSWGPGYEVSLEFYIHGHVAGNSAGYAWFFIVHSAEDPNMGYGAPAVWLNSNGYLYIYFWLDADNKSHRITQAVPTQQWTSFKLASIMENQTVSLSTRIVLSAPMVGSMVSRSRSNFWATILVNLTLDFRAN